MNVQKNLFNKEISNNSNIFLGKKIESQEKCKLCHKKDNLIKCFKCFNYYCQECLNNEFKLFNESESGTAVFPKLIFNIIHL